MTGYAELVIEPLCAEHDRSSFSCGTASLDEYIKRQARQDVSRRISRVFVATTAKFPSTIVGYYTLSTLSIELGRLPPALAHKLPHHPVPTALLGRLAVSQAAQGHGVGKLLLTDAIKRTISVSQDIAIYAVIVDAIDEQAQRFYERFGFSLLSADTRRLFLPLRSI